MLVVYLFFVTVAHAAAISSNSTTTSTLISSSSSSTLSQESTASGAGSNVIAQDVAASSSSSAAGSSSSTVFQAAALPLSSTTTSGSSSDAIIQDVAASSLSSAAGSSSNTPSQAATSSTSTTATSSLGTSLQDPTSSSAPSTIAPQNATITSSSSPQDLITPAPVSLSVDSTAYWSIEPCYPGAGEDCSRSNQPWLTDYLSSMYFNPYYNTRRVVTFTREGANATADSLLASSCGSIWDSSLSNWLSTAPITIVSSYAPYIAAGEMYPDTTTTSTITELVWSSAIWSSVVSDFMTTFTSYTYDYSYSLSETTITYTGFTSTGWTMPGHVSALYLDDFTYTPSGACCSSCIMTGGDVQVMHWPTPAPSPPVSILVDKESNFTL